MDKDDAVHLAFIGGSALLAAWAAHHLAKKHGHANGNFPLKALVAGIVLVSVFNFYQARKANNALFTVGLGLVSIAYIGAFSKKVRKVI